jgi:RNA polymerase sigma-70 factor, ECF subfamily
VSLACNIRRVPGFAGLVNHGAAITVKDLLWWWLDIPANSEGAAADPAPVDDEDARCLARGAAGDQIAWQELFDKWKKPLLSFFYRSLGSSAAAEDLTLEVFVRLHRAAEGYRQTASFATYLFHIARNLLRNELRRRRRKPADALPPEAFDYLASDDDHQRRRLAELEELVQRGLAQLPESQRTLLLLVHQQGFEPAEAAAALGITENALRVQLHRARQNLKAAMPALH